MENTAKERVIKEWRELDEKIDKLVSFMGSPKYEKMTEAERELLLQQLNAMINYSRALRARLTIWREI